jgi:Uma2 family endonuclease
MRAVMAARIHRTTIRDYNADMSTRTADYLEAIEHLPDGTTLVIYRFSWDDYERLLEDLRERPHLRVSYDQGKLEIMSPLPEHEEYARFIDDLVRAFSEAFDMKLQKYGAATWKRQRLARGVEPDACYYVANADRVIGKRKFDLEFDPPPDIVVEIDITNESLNKFPIYAALSVPEIWRYDSNTVQFYELAGDNYREIFQSRSFAGLTPAGLATALAQNKTEGQTAALRTFRQRWP